MPYALKMALRHLLSHPGQTALLTSGVAVGVGVFIFMSALIGGLATLLTLRTVGSIPHVVLEMPERKPAILRGLVGAQVVVQKDLSRRDQITVWQPFLPAIQRVGGVTAISPQIRGSGFVQRGQAIAPIGVIGVERDKLSTIADIRSALVSGNDALPVDGILIGSILADDLGLHTGQVVRLTSDRGRARNFRIGGIFTLGIASADRQAVYMNLTAARALFDLPSGLSRIEVKVAPVTAAPEIARELGRITGLQSTAWTQENAQLLEGLDAQARTGAIIKAFALITIVIGIASAMLLSVVRRQAEIGIIRAVGGSKHLVLSIFVIEGTLIGLAGALVGAGVAWLALVPAPPIGEVRSGGLPVEIADGDFMLAIILTTLSAAAASLLPARQAARVDPVEAIVM
jgi:lipoprotein-releasing system permease protein